jgi:hypothetical protein
MPGITGFPNPSFKLISGYLNGENLSALGVAAPASSGMLVSTYGGFLGGKWALSADDALKMSNTTTGTLYGGLYQCVKTSATALANPSRGRLVFWDTTAAEDTYQVCQDETQNGGLPEFAGVLLNTVTPGNYTWIQIAGRATLQLRASITSATRFIGWSGAGSGVDNATADGIAANASFTPALITGLLGLGEAVAANGALAIVNLRNLILRQ